MMRKLAFSLVLISGAASADVSLVYPQQAQCKSTMTSIQISGSRMRMDSVMDEKKYSMLFDGMEDIITTLDHSSRQYHQSEVDEDALDYNADVMSSTGTFIDKQMQAMQAQMKQQCAEMEKQGMSCPNMDLSSIMQSAQAMTAQDVSKMEVRPSDNNQTVAGMACKSFDRFENDSKKSEECYVEPKDMLMSAKDKKYLLRNMKLMTHYAHSFAGLSEKLNFADKQTPARADPADKDILLLQVCFSTNGSETGRVEVQMSSAVIDEASFDIPPGYQVMRMMEQ